MKRNKNEKLITTTTTSTTNIFDFIVFRCGGVSIKYIVRIVISFCLHKDFHQDANSDVSCADDIHHECGLIPCTDEHAYIVRL